MSPGFLFIAVPLAKSDIPTTLRNLRNAFRELWRRKQVLPYFVRSEERDSGKGGKSKLDIGELL